MNVKMFVRMYEEIRCEEKMSRCEDVRCEDEMIRCEDVMPKKCTTDLRYYKKPSLRRSREQSAWRLSTLSLSDLVSSSLPFSSLLFSSLL